MKKTLNIVMQFSFLLALFLMPSVSYATDITVSGAGTVGVDGCYEDQSNGTWIQDGAHTYWIHNDFVGGDNYCIIIANGTPSGLSKYFNNTGASVCSVAGATADAWGADAGANPVPTVTSGCGGTPPFTGGGSTSTIDQAQQNLSSGVYIFLIAFLGMVWLFRKRN